MLWNLYCKRSVGTNVYVLSSTTGSRSSNGTGSCSSCCSRVDIWLWRKTKSREKISFSRKEQQPFGASRQEEYNGKKWVDEKKKKETATIHMNVRISWVIPQRKRTIANTRRRQHEQLIHTHHDGQFSFPKMGWKFPLLISFFFFLSAILYVLFFYSIVKLVNYKPPVSNPNNCLLKGEKLYPLLWALVFGLWALGIIPYFHNYNLPTTHIF